MFLESVCESKGGAVTSVWGGLGRLREEEGGRKSFFNDVCDLSGEKLGKDVLGGRSCQESTGRVFHGRHAGLGEERRVRLAEDFM